MPSLSDKEGRALQGDVCRLLKRLSLKFKCEPGNEGEKKLDFLVSHHRGRVWIEAKNRFDCKISSLESGEVYVRTGYPVDGNFRSNILTGVQRKVRDAIEQYRGQTYDVESKLIIALSYSDADAKMLEDAITGRSYNVVVIHTETGKKVADEWTREASEVFKDEYPEMIGILCRYTKTGRIPRFRYYPNVKVDWRSDTPEPFFKALSESDIQRFYPTDIEEKWDPSKYSFLSMKHSAEFIKRVL